MNNSAFDLIDGASTYGRYDTDSIYTYDPGIFVLAVASEVPATVVVRQHGGQTRRTVKFDIAKQGNPPVIPGPADQIGDDRLVSSSINVPTPIPNPNTGGMNFRVQGEYIYVALSDPKRPGYDVLPAVGFPFVLPAQDTIAAQTIGNRSQDDVQDSWIRSGMILQNRWAWTVSSFPSGLLANPELLG